MPPRFLTASGSSTFRRTSLHWRETTVVIPLLQRDEQPTPIGRLHPLLLIEGDERVLATHLMTVVRHRLLSTPMTSLVRYEYEIKGAMDLLVGGV